MASNNHVLVLTMPIEAFGSDKIADEVATSILDLLARIKTDQIWVEHAVLWDAEHNAIFEVKSNRGHG